MCLSLVEVSGYPSPVLSRSHNICLPVAHPLHFPCHADACVTEYILAEVTLARLVSKRGQEDQFAWSVRGRSHLVQIPTPLYLGQ